MLQRGIKAKTDNGEKEWIEWGREKSTCYFTYGSRIRLHWESDIGVKQLYLSLISTGAHNIIPWFTK